MLSLVLALPGYADTVGQLSFSVLVKHLTHIAMAHGGEQELGGSKLMPLVRVELQEGGYGDPEVWGYIA